MILAMLLTLAACSNSAKKQLGLLKDPPDEFAVVTRAPLSLPPDFGLKPPEPGAVRPQEEPTSDRAREAVFGIDGAEKLLEANSGPRVRLTSNASTAAPQIDVTRQTVGESAILRMAGAEQADPEIRRLVDRESALLVDADLSFLDRLLSFRDPAPPGTLLDATGEAKRLRENQALGLPVTDGPTPQIERKDRGLLEGLF